MTTTTHTTGYHVWLYGERYWHRTLEGARRRVRDAQGWCNGEHAQIVECSSGEQVSTIED